MLRQKLQVLDLLKLRKTVETQPRSPLRKQKYTSSLDVSPIKETTNQKQMTEMKQPQFEKQQRIFLRIDRLKKSNQLVKLQQPHVRQQTQQQERQRKSQSTHVNKQKFQSQPDLIDRDQSFQFNTISKQKVLTDVEYVEERSILPRVQIMEQTFGIQKKKRFPKHVFDGNVSKLKKQFQQFY